jgi:hypothetical protein
MSDHSYIGFRMAQVRIANMLDFRAKYLDIARTNQVIG